MPDDAFLSFSLGPVQSFIGAARTVRDLWTGSYLLSWLTFQAMRPVLEKLVFPDMRENPLWLWHTTRKIAEQDELLSPCLTNRFLAKIPAATAGEVAKQCAESSRQAWGQICERVREVLYQLHPHPTLTAGGDTLWQRQVASFFEFRAVVLPWSECSEERLKKLLGTPLPPGREKDRREEDRLWPARWLAAGKLLQASRAVRHFPDYSPAPDDAGRFAQKCRYLAFMTHLGPAERRETGVFWKEAAERWNRRGSRTGPRERLCAISLVKRFAWAHYFSTKQVFDQSPTALRFEDTATVAARRWLKGESSKPSPPLDPTVARQADDRHHSWSGQWLHWTKKAAQDPDEEPVPESVWRAIEAKREKQGPPPSYYAVLMMDADNMGDRLLQGGREQQGKISAALAHFALKAVKSIVEKDHDGQLIYAGGDDVLAVLPTETVLACASALNDAFRRNWEDKVDKQDGPATLSAGLVVAHFKEDLRFVLDQARQAEKAAKNAGRKAAQIAVCRRSGEHSSALCPWEFIRFVSDCVQAFLDKASDRWAYHLRSEMETLQGLPPEAAQQEIVRQVNRSEENTKLRLGGAAVVGEAFESYRRQVMNEPWRRSAAQALEDFITLCQTASFLARGRDT